MGRALFNGITAKKTGLGCLFYELINQSLIAAAEKDLSLILQFRVKDTGITKEGVLADLDGLGVLGKFLERVHETND